MIYEGTIIPPSESNTFEFSGVKGGKVTVNSPSLVGINSVVIGLPLPIESNRRSVSSVSLPGNNYYSGGTTLNSGYLYVGTSNSLGSGDLTVENGGTVGLAPVGNNVLLDTPIFLESALLHLNTATSGKTLTLGGPIDGGASSSLLIDGAVELDGSNSAIETITVNNGTTLTLGGDQSSGQATVIGTPGTAINFTSASPQVRSLALCGSAANFADGGAPSFPAFRWPRVPF